MTTKTIFNMDSTLKRATMRKAKREGLSLSAFLNLAARAYVSKRFEIGFLERQIEGSRSEVRAGRFISQEALLKRLGI